MNSKSKKQDALKINMVKTDTICFISDCNAIRGYDYEYHRSEIQDLYFDGKKPQKTFYPNWMKIERYPSKVQKLVSGELINIRYELKNKDLASDKLPEVILYKDENNYDSNVIDSLYKYKYDNAPDYFVDVPVEFSIVCEVDNFKEPVKFDYTTIIRNGWNDDVYHIKNVDIKHQLFDKMIFPEVMLHSRPCSLSSKQVYDITRQYVKEHIDTKWAKITSDYDFCFTVKKIIPLIEPESFTYSNIFARTKRERNKIHYGTRSFKEVEVFQMTHNQENYSGYTAINSITANSETELKEKLDEWLTTLMELINKPLEMCPYCNGTGYVDKAESISSEQVINDINKKGNK